MTRKRIAVVTSEVLGVSGTGGPGTADSFLAVALGRAGHRVELLVAPGRDIGELSAAWRQTYADANVDVRAVPDLTRVEPSFLAPGWHVHETLRSDPPDVVIADDWRALPFVALRSRQLERSLERTAIILYCHGPARVFAEAARKVPDTVARFGEEVAQRTCFELADAVVSPSAWLLSCLRTRHWPEPHDPSVIQNLWESVALGTPVAQVPSGSRIRRIAFFGHLREGKGLRVFVSALGLVERRLLDGIELVFLGHARRWSATDLREMLPAGLDVRFETTLERGDALAELAQPGTLAMMPSLLENSPYAVAECLEHGIPFLASNVGGTPELIAEGDRARVLCAPTPEAVAAGLAAALASEQGVAPARPARPPEQALESWLALVEHVSPPARRSVPGQRDDFTVVGDGVDEELTEALLAAQEASGADAVTTGVRTSDGVRLFLGDAGALGLVENQYGVGGLVRRSELSDDGGESPWALFARLAAGGARIVSIPEPLATHPSNDAGPADRLAVLEAFEAAAPERLHDLPQLAATLAASAAREPGSPRPGFVERLRRRLLG
jgi:glycosyltransferase involved in cell wall biosynthesis